MFLALSCLGTRSVRSEKISRRRIALCGAAGILLFFCGGWLLRLPLPVRTLGPLYGLTLLAGYCLMLAAGVWLGRLIKERVFEDPFNDENESFMQETRLMTNDYSVNLPYAVLLRKTLASGLDQRRQSLPRDDGARNARFGKDPMP